VEVCFPAVRSVFRGGLFFCPGPDTGNSAPQMFDNVYMSGNQYELVIFEDSGYVNLLPLVYARPVFELRCGCRTLRRRICSRQQISQPTLYVRPELAAVTAEQNIGRVERQLGRPGRTLFINGRCLLFDPITEPDGELVAYQAGQLAYIWADPELAAALSCEVLFDNDRSAQLLGPKPAVQADVELVRYPWDLVQNNIRALEADWRLLDEPAMAGRMYPGVHLLAQEHISIGSGSVVKPGTVLDAEPGPIMIGQNVTIRPNCTLEGPLFIGDNSLIQPGALINEGVSIGPVCKVGGELESSIVHSYSNKQHDGFLGHSYIGQWVNLAADTVNSDLKNTYGPVRVPINGREVDSGAMLVGLTMGDHSKTSVNTMFSTGSVVGFACSVFSSHFAPRFLPSFSWLTDGRRTAAIPEKVLEVAQHVMARRHVALTPAMKELFLKIPELARRHELLA